MHGVPLDLTLLYSHGSQSYRCLPAAVQLCNRSFSLAFLCVANGGLGALYILLWMFFDTLWCVVTGVSRLTAWDPITYGLFDFTVAPGGIVMLAWRWEGGKGREGRIVMLAGLEVGRDWGG